MKFVQPRSISAACKFVRGIALMMEIADPNGTIADCTPPAPGVIGIPGANSPPPPAKLSAGGRPGVALSNVYTCGMVAAYAPTIAPFATASSSSSSQLSANASSTLAAFAAVNPSPFCVALSKRSPPGSRNSLSKSLAQCVAVAPKVAARARLVDPIHVAANNIQQPVSDVFPGLSPEPVPHKIFQPLTRAAVESRFPTRG